MNVTFTLSLIIFKNHSAGLSLIRHIESILIYTGKDFYISSQKGAQKAARLLEGIMSFCRKGYFFWFITSAASYHSPSEEDFELRHKSDTDSVFIHVKAYLLTANIVTKICAAKNWNTHVEVYGQLQEAI